MQILACVHSGPEPTMTQMHKSQISNIKLNYKEQKQITMDPVLMARKLGEYPGSAVHVLGM